MPSGSRIFAQADTVPRPLRRLWPAHMYLIVREYIAHYHEERPHQGMRARISAGGLADLWRRRMPGILGRGRGWATSGMTDPGQWKQQQAFFMAMRLKVPLLELLAEPHWKPADRRMDHPPLFGLHYDGFAVFMRAMSLALVPLILAGLTGILKRKD